MGQIMLLTILGYILVFYCGIKIGRELSNKRFSEFIMDEIDKEIENQLNEDDRNSNI